MQCRQCGYRLWNIQSRHCPECGQGFTPSEFEYVPGSVAFCCPHCDQNYFGMDQRGQLVPSEFDCIECGNHVHMDEMVLRPAEGYEEQQTRQNVNPWETRDKRKSTFKAWLRTCATAMLRPTDLVTQQDAAKGVGSPIGFLLFHTAITMLCGAGILVVIATAGGLMRGNAINAIFSMLTGLGLLVFISMLVVLLVVAIWSGVTHVILKMLGKPAGRYGDTFACMCYANGATVLTALPLCGIYALSWLGMIWWPISAGIMLAKRHQMTVFKALIAVWVLPVLLFVGSSAAIGYVIYSIQSGTGMRYSPTVSTVSLGADILNEVHNDQTIGPKHVAQYFFDNKHDGWEWQVSDFAVNQYTGGLQEGFNNLRASFQEERQGIRKAHRTQLQNAIELLPQLDGAGYRFGSMLFLYNKVTTDKLDPELWLVVHWPRMGNVDQHTVFKANGTQVTYTTTELLEALDEQDALRRKLGLPEIESLDAIRIVPIPTNYTGVHHDEPLAKYDLSGFITSIVRDDGQIGPDHVLRLLMADKLATDLFADVDGKDVRSRWNAAANDTSMNNWHDKWMKHASTNQKNALKTQLDELPPRSGTGMPGTSGLAGLPGGAGYRFGQMVMVYDGITKDKLDDRLWLAVRWPKTYAPEQTKIYLADGRMIHVLTDEMPKLLVEQDDLRNELGLPMIVELGNCSEVPLKIDTVR